MSKKNDNTQYIFEPEKEDLLNKLLPRVIYSQIYRSFLEASASEQAARMIAMDGATNNASEMIQKLTLDFNKARQAQITRELIEISSAIEAMR
ncbi:MAG TPA: F0F1 ATP synthase subunit gamma [Deltaproteobacteria bacterium]|nr:F0F1 ATP synthase subunit gamma [Deltaproteobacteria bacterium]